MRLKRFGVIPIGVALFLILGAMFFVQHQSRISTNKIFGNMSYLSDSPYFSENVLLVDGRYEWNYTSVDNVFLSYYLQYEVKYVYGDFNHDGLKDAAVIYTENSGGNADWYTLAFLINDGKKLVHQASGILDDRAIINSLRQQNGKVIVDLFVHQDDDCMGGPTKHVKSVFEYSENNRWIEGKQSSAKSVFDPVILMLKEPSFLLDLPSWDYVLRRCKI
jgi:hypothetical protein